MKLRYAALFATCTACWLLVGCQPVPMSPEAIEALERLVAGGLITREQMLALRQSLEAPPTFSWETLGGHVGTAISTLLVILGWRGPIGARRGLAAATAAGGPRASTVAAPP